MAREKWDDERIDESFGRVDDEIRELRVEMRNGFEKVDRQFERVDDRFDAMQKNMTTWFIALFSSIVTMFATAVFALISLV